jgi:PPOX class probable F420-dependent enzyme
MVQIPDAARDVILSGRLAHLVTLNPDGSPQVSCVWVDLQDGEILVASMAEWAKHRNVRRDPRVSLSIETSEQNSARLNIYLVVHGRARITEGGGSALLQELAYRYIEPGVQFPPMDDPPDGVIMRISPERLGGIGPWMD